MEREFNAEKELMPWPENHGREGRVSRAIIAFTELDRKILAEFHPGGQDRRPLHGGMTRVTAWPDRLLIGPVLGAPQAAMAMEFFGRRGVETFLSLGWCGSLREDVRIGDIVMPVTALSEEGTSAHYPGAAGDGEPQADSGLCRILGQEMASRGLAWREGRVWTTDAPFRETRDKVDRYGGQGLLAVDMESSALMAVARFRGWRWAGLMVVSDLLWGESWQSGFKSPELKHGLKQAAETITSVLDRLAKADPPHLGVEA